MGSSAPKPPDYVGAAQQTAASNQAATAAQTALNRPNENGLLGSQTYDAATNTFTQGLNPQYQGMADLLRGQAMDAYGQPLPTGQEAANALYSQATSRLDPQWAQQAEATRSQLYNQGLREGDPAFDTAMQNFNRSKNDAYTSAENTAQAGANQRMQADLAVRNAPGQELSGLLGSFNSSLPQYAQAQNAGGANYLGAAQDQYQSAIDAYNAKNAQTQGWISGATGLLGAGLGAALKR